MRIAKRFHLLLFFSLGLLLVCGQLPELFTLIDDTSNDFVEDSLPSISNGVEKAPVPTLSQHGVVLGEEPNTTVSLTPSTQSLPSSSPDLLRLLSIQRK